ncbi:MAG: triphosphoribosyl-dephospho-CoA synthase [Lachnospiraceae bacterium]|nr:triphosphoribosyl-dephospho-CoA synthase [Lachnospiraceae bacterium]
MMTDGKKTADAGGIARCAVKALIYEVSVTPKPGLVDRADCGAHGDMDFFTFLDSALVLTPYFEECAAAGIRAAENAVLAGLLAKLREPGKEAERKMLLATGGVNTHKGAIFLLGLLTAAAGYCLGSREQKDPAAGSCPGEPEKELKAEEILRTAGCIAAPVMQDFAQAAEASLRPAAQDLAADPDAAPAETAGLKQYRENGCTGIRGEAAGGFPSLKNVALPRLIKERQAGASINDAGVAVLLDLILSVEDTTLLKRCGSRKALEAERELLRELLQKKTPVEAAGELNERWTQKGYSAGGCADLLGAAFFLLFIENI